MLHFNSNTSRMPLIQLESVRPGLNYSVATWDE